MTVSILWLFLTMAWVGLHCMIVVFPDHIHLLLIKHDGGYLFLISVSLIKTHRCIKIQIVNVTLHNNQEYVENSRVVHK